MLALKVHGWRGQESKKMLKFLRQKCLLLFFIIPMLKPFKSSTGITKLYFQLNFHGNIVDNFYGPQTESFFFSCLFTLSNYKGIVEQTESPPESWVADHRTARAVTFSLLERYKKYLEGRRRHINANSLQNLSKIEEKK